MKNPFIELVVAAATARAMLHEQMRLGSQTVSNTRTRIAGKPGQPGDKLARKAHAKTLTLRHGAAAF